MRNSTYKSHTRIKANVGSTLTHGFQNFSGMKKNCSVKPQQLSALAQKWHMSLSLIFHFPTIVTESGLTFKGQEVHSHLHFVVKQYWILAIMSNAHHNDIFNIEW